ADAQLPEVDAGRPLRIGHGLSIAVRRRTGGSLLASNGASTAAEPVAGFTFGDHSHASYRDRTGAAAERRRPDERASDCPRGRLGWPLPQARPLPGGARADPRAREQAPRPVRADTRRHPAPRGRSRDQGAARRTSRRLGHALVLGGERPDERRAIPRGAGMDDREHRRHRLARARDRSDRDEGSTPARRRGEGLSGHGLRPRRTRGTAEAHRADDPGPALVRAGPAHGRTGRRLRRVRRRRARVPGHAALPRPHRAKRVGAETSRHPCVPRGRSRRCRGASRIVRARLRELARDAWIQHERAEREVVPHLVRPSIPILFFGDSERFAASPLRVITVGLNPSREEFPRAAPFLRFPAAEGASGRDPDRYLASLDAYFRTAPYTGWFNPSFEPLLRGLGSSYYDGALSAALHTEL